MADGVFRRFIELVLDRNSARKAERDTQESLGRATNPAVGVRNLNSFFNTAARLAAQATGALAGYAVAFGRMIERGGEFINVQRAFSNAVGNAGAALTTLRKATGGLISDYDLMVGFNKTLALGAVKTVEQFGEMTAVAQKLGKALGIDATTAMERLSLGIARHSPKILDDLGITAKAGDDVATVLEKAREAAERFGVASDNNADRLKRLSVAFVNFKDGVSKFLATWEGFGPLLFEGANVLTTLTEALQSADAENVKEAFGAFGALLGSLFVQNFADAVAKAFDSLTFKKSGLLGTILGAGAGAATGILMGSPFGPEGIGAGVIGGAVAGAAGGAFAPGVLRDAFRDISKWAESNANAQIVAMGAMRGQLEAAAKLEALRHKPPTPLAPVAFDIVGGRPVPRRNIGPEGAGVSIPEIVSENAGKFDELVKQYRSGFGDIENAAQAAAFTMQDAFQNAFDGLFQEGETFADFFADIFKGAAAAALAGIAQFASAKVAENIAKAFEQRAEAAASLALPIPDIRGAAMHTAAAHGFLLSAAKYALVGGAAGAAAAALSGIGGGGSSGAGSDLVAGQADKVGTTGPEIHLHIDGVDPNNPRHQAALGAAVRTYQQRYGSRITVNG